MTLKTLQANLSEPIYKVAASHSLLVLIHLTGILGIATKISEYFILLTPFTLILSLAIIFYNHERWTKTFLFIGVLCFSVGLIIEIIGTKTGVIFGSYTYGKTLGWKIAGVPIVIGFNWLMLVYCSAAVINAINETWNWLFKAFLSSLLMVGLDLLIEPIAMRYDFWSWANDIIPIQNYLGWFVISFILLSFTHKLLKINNLTAITLFFSQLLFFAVLNLVG